MICFPLDNTDYTAKDLGAYLCTRTRGVFSADDNLAVTANNNMTVTVSSGIVWLKWSKYWGTSAVQPQAMTLPIERADGALSRIDAVYVRLNKVQNLAEIGIKKGSFSSSPTVAAPVRNDNYDELYLATVLISGGVVKITQAAITDMRTNDAYCGIMRDAVTGIPTANLQAQAQELIDHLHTQITAIEQGSAVMLKSVFVGKTADSVKKADSAETCTGNAATATTALACTGNAATVGDNSTLKSVGAITTTPFLAAWEGKTVRCIAPTDVEVGAARKIMGNKDRNSIYMNWGAPVSGAINFTVDSSGNLPVAKAQSCTGHAALDAYAPQEATYKPQTGSETVIGVYFYHYPSGYNKNNCFVSAVFAGEKQLTCDVVFSATDIAVHSYTATPNDYFMPTKVIVQRYK